VSDSSPPAAAAAAARRPSRAIQALSWLITLACFAYLYRRIGAAAGPGESPLGYLAKVFAGVSWTQWLLWMLPYSLLFLAIDTLVLWRAVSWFNAPVAYTSLLPVRASAYILSILNEQVGKGAIAVYLNRTRGVPGWQVGSSLLFIMFCEFYYLLCWALLGCLLTWSRLPAVFHAVPWIAAGALLFFAGFVWWFRTPRPPFGRDLRERDLLRSFRLATPLQYATIVLLRSPAMLAAVFVYSRCAALFGVEIPLREMLGFLPAIFFGTLVPGPFRAVAVALWPTLFPDHAAEMTAFGFVQHNSFVLFNAAIGLLFLRRANRELVSAGAS